MTPDAKSEMMRMFDASVEAGRFDRVPDCGSLLFSHRKQIAEQAEKWCRENGVEVCPLNIVTALNNMGVIYKPAAKRVLKLSWRAVSEAKEKGK